MDYVRKGGEKERFSKGGGGGGWVDKRFVKAMNSRGHCLPGSPGGDTTLEGSGCGVPASPKSPFHSNGREVPFPDLKGPHAWDHGSLSHCQ